MDKEIQKLTDTMKKVTITDKTQQMPPLKPCKKCQYNIGSDHNGLCATCDPNHRWWNQSKNGND